MAPEITRNEIGQQLSKTLADDITQETFIQVFKKFNTFDSTKPIKPWINKISIKTMHNMLRKQKRLVYTRKR
ncbi:RNA polymerase sigma factor [Paenibacillus pabuli]|uniref:RNA polymerase sigma factor n=1 Tax=Paenibacillus pabuli TaxID=1472 RepID=UPI003CEB5B26